MRTQFRSARTLAFAACCGLSIVGLGQVAVAQTATKTAEQNARVWPSSLVPKPPLQARLCSCLYAGQNVPIGETICMKFDDKRVLATCDTVVNNPSWSISKQPCPPS